jgi:hypothetical protein
VPKVCLKNELKNAYACDKNKNNIIYINVLKLILKAYLRHVLCSRDYISFASIFIYLFTPYFLFLLAK